MTTANAALWQLVCLSMCATVLATEPPGSIGLTDTELSDKLDEFTDERQLTVTVVTYKGKKWTSTMPMH